MGSRRKTFLGIGNICEGLNPHNVRRARTVVWFGLSTKGERGGGGRRGWTGRQGPDHGGLRRWSLATLSALHPHSCLFSLLTETAALSSPTSPPIPFSSLPSSNPVAPLPGANTLGSLPACHLRCVACSHLSSLNLSFHLSEMGTAGLPHREGRRLR